MFPEFSLPFRNPVLIFSIVLFIILLAPIALKRLKVPGVIGYIMAGVVIGEYGLNLLVRDSSFLLFGQVGLLYIMFLAGLEIDLQDFKRNRNKSFGFGFISFTIPLLTGTCVFYYLLNFTFPASLLMGSMFASHTLLAYPIISRLGLVKNEAVNITVGGTVITDTGALMILAMVASSATGALDSVFLMRLIISTSIFVFIVLWVFPRITKWFFRNANVDGGAQYVFVLAVVFASAFLAQLAGIEPIIGAFLAGLALNRLVPHTSPLMNRIEFVGNTLFIPFFLIGVGMLGNLRIIFDGTEALVVAVTMITIAIGGKYLAAFIIQKLYGYNKQERNIIFGLSSSQAAATLAVVLVAYNIRFDAAGALVPLSDPAFESAIPLLGESVLNGTILMILVTCFVAAMVAEKSGRKLAIIHSEKIPELSEIPQRILVPIANPASIEMLLDFSIMIKDQKNQEPIYPIAVVRDDEEADEKIRINNQLLEKAVKYASATENAVQLVSRVDVNIANGILRAIKELLITDIVVGWNAQITTSDKVLGSVLDQIIRESNEMILITSVLHPLNTFDRILVVFPKNAELEPGFARWVLTLKTLSKQIGAKLIFYGPQNDLPSVDREINISKPQTRATFNVLEELDKFISLKDTIGEHDLLVVITARAGTVSFQPTLETIPKKIATHLPDASFVILYPEQSMVISKYSKDTDNGEDEEGNQNQSKLGTVGRVLTRLFNSKFRNNTSNQ